MLFADSAKYSDKRDNPIERERKRKMPNSMQRRSSLNATTSKTTHNTGSSEVSISHLRIRRKLRFFDGVEPIRNTTLSHYRRKSTPQLFEIDATIVKTINGSMYFNVDAECDSEEETDKAKVARCANGRQYSELTSLETQKRAMSIFVSV